MNIYKDIKTVFNQGSIDYLEDDVHWGDDSDIVYEYGKTLESKLGRKINIFYGGVGPGHILAKILSQKRYWNKFVAVDYSRNMLKLAENRLKRLSEIDREINQTNLYKVDLLKLKEKYRSGIFDMVICFNNTLGNIVLPNESNSIEESHEKAKKIVLENFKFILKNNGYLIISVYNYENISLDSGAYTKNLKIKEKISQQSFLLKYCKNGKGHNFFTHWFRQQEISDLVTRCGFEINDILYRRERMIIVAKKK